MNKLSDVFDIAPTYATLAVATTEVSEVSDTSSSTDFEVARKNTYALIDMTNAAIQTAMVVAAETQNPRALEVLGQLLKTSAEINKQLLMLNKDIAEINTVNGSNKKQTTQTNHIQNAVFVGSGGDLNKLINKEK